MMKERSLLMSAPMVIATLRDVDPKTQTRRLQGLEFVNNDDPDAYTLLQLGIVSAPGHRFSGKYGAFFQRHDGKQLFCPAPYGPPGTPLWVREAWRLPAEYDDLSGGDVEWKIRLSGCDPRQVLPVAYEADNVRRGWGDEKPGRYRHARFMPRWASRVDLVQTALRIERLRDISEADVAAEGWTKRPEVSSDPRVHYEAARDWYTDLWESLNGIGSWQANPYVWVVEFRDATIGK